jgi:hypothetical protein
VKFITKKRSDVTNANAVEFNHLNVLPWLIINLYVTFSLVLVRSQLTFS